MNKEGWEIKKLGGIFSLYQPKTISTNEMKVDGEYPVFGANGIIGRYDKYNHEYPELLMTCRGATCGALNISEPYSWINGNAMVIHPKDRSSIIFKFIYYQLLCADLSCVITGAAQPQITRQSLESLNFVIPPLPIQKQIVAELDTLSDIIAKKRQQLSELDRLAQAIFYHLFGDPVENEMGWKMKKIEDVAPVKARKEDIISTNGLYWLLNLDMIESQTGRIIDYQFERLDKIGNSTNRFDSTNILYSKLRPYLNKVVLPNMEGYATSELVPLKPDPKLLNKYFLSAFLRSKFFVYFIQEKVTGAKMPRTDMKVFRNFHVILPPLSLQNQFAEQIKTMEKQKEFINQSIAETQKLFDYTMDKYFN